MKKLFLKSVSIMLAVLFAVSSFACVNVFAVSDNTQYATVFVDGIRSEQIVRFNDDNTVTNIFPTSEEIVKSAFATIPKSFFNSLLQGNNPKKIFGDMMIGVLNGFFGELGCDCNGVPKENTGIQIDNTKPRFNAEKRGYYFTFDCRISPFEVAKQLNAFVQNVKIEADCDKVNFVVFSMGGAMFSTYLSVYGNDDVASAVLNSTAILGATVCSEPMSSKISIAPKNLVQFIDCLIDPGVLNDFVISFASTLQKYFGLDITLEKLEEMLFSYYDEIYTQVLFPTFATWPGFWALVSQNDYEYAKDLIFSDKAEEYKGLIEINDSYHYGVQSKAKELIDGLFAKGINVGIISKYNMPIVPVVYSYDQQSDLVLDTRYTSLGATCAKLNEKLPDDYAQQKFTEKNYISPDRVIDASTCWYPEYTWFIRDMDHGTFGESFMDFIDYIKYSESQPTVEDNPRYPQFMQYSNITGEISPLVSTKTPEYSPMGIIDFLFSLVKRLFTLIAGLFTK